MLKTGGVASEHQSPELPAILKLLVDQSLLALSAWWMLRLPVCPFDSDFALAAKLKLPLEQDPDRVVSITLDSLLFAGLRRAGEAESSEKVCPGHRFPHTAAPGHALSPSDGNMAYTKVDAILAGPMHKTP